MRSIPNRSVPKITKPVSNGRYIVGLILFSVMCLSRFISVQQSNAEIMDKYESKLKRAKELEQDLAITSAITTQADSSMKSVASALGQSEKLKDKADEFNSLEKQMADLKQTNEKDRKELSERYERLNNTPPTLSQMHYFYGALLIFNLALLLYFVAKNYEGKPVES